MVVCLPSLFYGGNVSNSELTTGGVDEVGITTAQIRLVFFSRDGSTTLVIKSNHVLLIYSLNLMQIDNHRLCLTRLLVAIWV